MNIVAIQPPPQEILRYEETDDEGLFSLKGLFGFFARRAALIAAVAIPTFVVCFAIMQLEQPKYTATAEIMISPGGQTALPNSPLAEQKTNAPTQMLVASQLDLLHSRTIMGRLVDALNLVDDPEWNLPNPAFQRGSLWDFVRSATASSPEEPKQPASLPRGRMREQVIKKVSDAFEVRQRSASLVAEVSVTSANPERAAQMANRAVALFIERQRETQRRTLDGANSALSTRLRQLTNDVREKEKAVETHRAEHGLFNTGDGPLTGQQLSELQAEVIRARTDFARKEARYRQMRDIVQSGGSLNTMADAIQSDQISQLRAREADIRRRQADAESRYGELHPVVRNIRAERQDIDAQIGAALAREGARVRNDMEVARTGVARMEEDLRAVQDESVAENDSRARLAQLEREAKSASDVLEEFRRLHLQIQDTGAFGPALVTLVTEATPPLSKSSPNLNLAFIISLGLGIALGLAAGFLAETLAEGFRTSDEIERKTGVQALTNVPKLYDSDLRSLPRYSQHPAGYLVERQMSAFTEAIRVLRTTILFPVSQPKSRVVAISSALPEEGKTTVSLCLARVCALARQRVLLIDCDLRKCSLKHVLGIEPRHGLLKVLSGQANWREATYVDDASGLYLLPLQKPDFASGDVLSSGSMQTLLEELREAFDLVILDCAPALAVAETRVVAAHADAAVLVARWGKTPSHAVCSALQQLQNAGANVLGIALNRIDTRVPGYAYDMKGYYRA